MSDINVRVQNPEKLLRLLTAGGVVSDEIRIAFKRSAMIVESEAKKLAPVDRGGLRASITHEVDPRLFPKYAHVGVGVKYGKAVHEGRPPGKMPPVKPLQEWIRRKKLVGDDGKPLSAWAVAKSIEKKGIKPNPFLTDALDNKRKDVVRQFDSALERIQRKWHD